MILKGSLSYINEFFLYIINKIRKIYLSSGLYNNKISKINLVPKYTYNKINGNELYVFQNIKNNASKIYDSINNELNNEWKFKFSFISPNL